MNERPNIVVVVAEQWRGDLAGCSGHPSIRTPNLDELSVDGLAFSLAFSTSPICTPSRCSLITGHYPHTRGHRTQRYLVGRDEPNLFASLKSEGYRTAMFGKNDVLHPSVIDDSLDLAGSPVSAKEEKSTRPQRRSNPYRHGDPRFYTFLWGAEIGPPESHPDARNVDRALRFADAVRDEAPFAFWLNLGLAHPPYRAHEPWWSLYDNVDVGPMAFPVNNSSKASYVGLLYRAHGLDRLSPDILVEMRRRYMAMISQADAIIGEVVSGLKSRGLWENTVLVVLSDHGNYGGDYGVPAKWWTGMEDALLRVPLVVHVPGQVRTGVCHELVQHFDINQTIRELASLDDNHPTSSRSLLPLINGSSDRPHRDAVLACGGHWLGQETPLSLDRSIFETLDDPEHLYYPWKKVIEENPAASARAFAIREQDWKYVWRQDGFHELYDLTVDRLEEHNLLAAQAPEPGERKIFAPRMATNDDAAGEALARLRLKLLDEVLCSADFVPRIYPDVAGSLNFGPVNNLPGKPAF